MSKYSNSMSWAYEGHEFEVNYNLDPGFQGCWGGGPDSWVQPDPPSLIDAEFVPVGVGLTAEQAAALVERMKGLLGSDDGFRALLESDCLDHAQAKEEGRAYDLID